MKEQLPSYPLRMPLDLRQKLETSALAGGRSLNAEIIARLQASFESNTHLTVSKETIESLLSDQEQRIKNQIQIDLQKLLNSLQP